MCYEVALSMLKNVYTEGIIKEAISQKFPKE